VAESAVINASPLIFLTRGGHLDLLGGFADRVFVPEPVAREIRSGSRHDVTVKALEEVSRIEITAVPQVLEQVLEWGLGVGE